MKRISLVLLAVLMILTVIPVQANPEEQTVEVKIPLEEVEEEPGELASLSDYTAAPLLLYAAGRNYSHPETEMQKALAYVDGVTDPLEIVVMLHDYLVRELDYDLRVWINGPEPEISHWSQGALTTGIAVCQGYSDAYCELLTRKGIECVRVQSSEMGHEWVKVKLGGNWYNVDVTYDDPVPESHEDISSFARGGFVTHNLLLKSDDEFLALDHYGQNPTDQMTDRANPAAVTSGAAFAGYAFNPGDGSYSGMLSKIGGSFYYLSYQNGSFSTSTLVKSAMNGSGKTEYTTEVPYQFLFSANGKLYANTDRYIYELNLDGTQKQCVAAVEGELLNFWYKNGAFGGWVKKADGSTAAVTFDVTKAVSNLITDENGFVYYIRDDGKLTLIEAPDVDVAAIPGTVSGKTVTAIAPSVFFKHHKLSTLTISEGIETIGESAFWNCAMLQKLYLPKSLKTLGNEAFLHCGNLMDVYFNGSVPAAWGKGVFTKDETCSVSIHYADDASGWTSPSWIDADGCVYSASSFAAGSLSREDMCGDNAYWKFEDGTLTVYGSGAMNNYTIANGKSTAPWTGLAVEKVVVAEGITSVGAFAFMQSPTLVLISLPESLTSIGQYAFYNCNMLPTMEIPAGVTSIGANAMAYCLSMAKVYFKGSAPTSIGDMIINGTTKTQMSAGGQTFVTTISYPSGASGWSKPTWNGYPTEVTGSTTPTGKLYLKKVGTDKTAVNVFVFTKTGTQPLVGFQMPDDSMVIPNDFAYGTYRVVAQNESGKTVMEYEAELDGPVVEVDLDFYEAGDVNLSGSITAADLQRLYRYQKEGNYSGKLRAVDVDRSGAFNAADFSVLFNHLKGVKMMVN